MKVGDKVEIVGGSFGGSKGTITEIDNDTGKVMVRLETGSSGQYVEKNISFWEKQIIKNG